MEFTVNIYWAPEEHYGLSILDTANSLYASCPVLLPSAHYINNSITVIASHHILHFRASCSNSDLSSIVVCVHISLCVWERERSWTLHISLQNDVQITFHVTASVYVYMCTCPCPQWTRSPLDMPGGNSGDRIQCHCWPSFWDNVIIGVYGCAWWGWDSWQLRFLSAQIFYYINNEFHSPAMSGAAQ